MELEALLLSSQEPATDAYSDADQSSAHSPTLDKSYYCPPIYT
jgi:hypothetical protein